MTSNSMAYIEQQTLYVKFNNSFHPLQIAMLKQLPLPVILKKVKATVKYVSSSALNYP